MRTIGNIERFLVIGIVVVIGAILTVAITGARDLQRERDQAAAKTAPTTKKGPALKRDLRAPPGPEGVKPESAKKSGSREDGAAERPVDPQADPQVQKLLQMQQDPAKAGELSGGRPPAAGGTEPKRPDDLGSKPDDSNVAGAPVVLEESGKREGSHAPSIEKFEPFAPDLDPRKDPKSDGVVPVSSSAKAYVYEVQKGDTLERIARALYGDGQRWKEIAAANPAIGDGHKIRAGDRLALSSAPTNESSTVHLKDAGASLLGPPAPANGGSGDAKSEAAAKAAAAAAFKRTTTLEQYQVQKGDTLMSIAAANYGTKAAWRLILDANSDKIPDKDRIKTGIVLKLPTN